MNIYGVLWGSCWIIIAGLTLANGNGCASPNAHHSDDLDKCLRLVVEVVEDVGDEQSDHVRLKVSLKNVSVTPVTLSEASSNSRGGLMIFAQMYAERDGMMFIDPTPLEDIWPRATLTLGPRMPVPVNPSHRYRISLEPGASQTLFFSNWPYRKPGHYRIWYTLFLPDDNHSEVRRPGEKPGVTLRSNTIEKIQE